MTDLADLERYVSRLTGAEKAELDKLLVGMKWDWAGYWARPNQLPPEGDWLTWLVLAGRGFGKTRCAAEWIRSRVDSREASRIALIAETQKDLEEVLVFGDSGIHSVFPPHQKPKITKKPIKIEFHTGAIATGYNATEPDQLRGPQFDTAICFIAGTMVTTQFSEQPIETIKVGDCVMTRMGLRRVMYVQSLDSNVGTVEFSNGRTLTGTADHPIYLTTGWTRLDQLEKGDIGCAVNASNGVAISGIDTATGITSAPTRAVGQKQLGFIGRCGSRLMGSLHPALMSTIRMTTKATTISTILSAFRGESICDFIERHIQSSARIGMQPLLSISNASIAASRSSARSVSTIQHAHVASTGPARKSGRSSESAYIAAQHSEPDSATCAVSVASTWRPSGRQKVYCLTVEGSPEYFANGILVHNCDEFAKFRYARETWDQLQFGLRLGKRPRVMITTTPRPIPILKEILKATTTAVTRGITTDNTANLAASFVKAITEKYAGTRLGRQELSAEILDDVPNALWTREALDRDRRGPNNIPPLKRIVVAIDPAAKTNEMPEDGAATGIVVAGVGDDGRGYVLDDATVRLSPNGWARMAVACFDRYQADCIVGEINNGGEMVEATVRAVRPTARFKAVHATRGKWTRAEPIAALYEQGRISHVGSFAPLEDEMVNFSANGMVGDRSPDRVDALVWALTELFPSITKAIKPLPKLMSGLPTAQGDHTSNGWMLS